MARFDGMQQRGLAVLQEGLSPLPKELTHSDSFPISFWISDLVAAVQFLFFAADSEGVFRPADLTFQYNRRGDGWHPINTQHFWNASRTDALGDSNFMRLQPHSFIETSGSSLETEPEPGRIGIVMSGFHAPEVAEIWLVQADRIDKRPASGLFGSWTICTELCEPLRVEAHDAAGVLLGVARGPHPLLELQ
jgi:hypothetical protein